MSLARRIRRLEQRSARLPTDGTDPYPAVTAMLRRELALFEERGIDTTLSPQVKTKLDAWHQSPERSIDAYLEIFRIR